MEHLRVVLNLAWGVLQMPLTIYGYTFSFAQIMLFDVVVGWLIWLWVNFVLD